MNNGAKDFNLIPVIIRYSLFIIHLFQAPLTQGTTMYKSIFLSLSAFCALCVMAGAAFAESHDWENARIFRINKEPARSVFYPFADQQQALTFQQANSPFVKKLDGTWKFHFAKNPSERPADFFKNDFDVSGWDDIQVPGNWQLQGTTTRST